MSMSVRGQKHTSGNMAVGPTSLATMGGLAVLIFLVAGASAACKPGDCGNGKATTYWDCCKTTCAWRGNAGKVTGPVRTCKADGVTTADENQGGGCADNISRDKGSFVCTDQAPFSEGGKEYGFAAANIDGLDQHQVCCACYELTFTNPGLKGKKITVQLINTGSDLVRNQFDIQVPGGGFGIFNKGCKKQWPGKWNWGNRYGGVTSRKNCDSIPKQLSKGCYFKFDWFLCKDQPIHFFKKVKCPQALVNRSKCRRLDE